MIKPSKTGHYAPMTDVGLGSAELPPALAMAMGRAGDLGFGGDSSPAGRAIASEEPSFTRDESNSSTPQSRVRGSAADARLRDMVGSHFDFIWRSLRRLGVPNTDVDDCVQQVFWVAARKLDLITDGSERAFLFSTALRVASDARRSRLRRREVHQEDEAFAPCDTGPRPDEVADQKRARALLDEVLGAMPIELRTVFVLFELEEMPTQEIAALLELPTGTVASRLRRAREEFHKAVTRLKHGMKFRETVVQGMSSGLDSPAAKTTEAAGAPRTPDTRVVRGGKR